MLICQSSFSIIGKFFLLYFYQVFCIFPFFAQAVVNDKKG